MTTAAVQHTATAMSTADWSALPGTALFLISAGLAASSAVDYSRFRSVCSSWRAAAAPPRRPRLPCLVVRQRSIRHHSTDFTFFGFNGDRLSPAMAELSDPVDIAFHPCSSSHGWLTILERITHRVTLWNPVTGARVALPPMNAIFDTVVLSSSDPATSVVLLTHSYGNKLAFCSPGDDLWTSIQKPPDLAGSHNAGIVFHRGRFYLAAGHRIYVYDVGPPARLERVRPSIPPVEDLLSGEKKWFSEQDDQETYLLESGEELLLINVHGETNKRSATVFQLVWEGDQVKLLRLQGLGELAVFVGSSTSFSLLANEFHGLKRNCIYRAYDKESHIRVIHLDDDRNELIPNLLEEYGLNGASRTWLTPNFI